MTEEEELKKIREQKEDLLKKMIAGPVMPKSIIHIDSVDQFNDLIEKYKEQVIIIDFHASWCQPCHMFAPVYEAAQKEWGDKFIFTKLDTEKLPDVSHQLQVMGIPNVMFIKNKKIIFQQAGAMQRHQFEMLLKRVKDAVEKADKGSMYS